MRAIRETVGWAALVVLTVGLFVHIDPALDGICWGMALMDMLYGIPWGKKV